MTGMPCAFAFAATAAPDSLLIEAMTSTFTWLVIMLSASVENFCSSPWAFWMSACSPAACIAGVSSGLSKPSQRAELAVSGRITPTLAPLAAAGVAEPPPLELGAAAFWPQAASERARPSPAATRAALVERIVVLPHQEMLWRTTYAEPPCGAKHTESFKSSRNRHGLVNRGPSLLRRPPIV